MLKLYLQIINFEKDDWRQQADVFFTLINVFDHFAVSGVVQAERLGDEVQLRGSFLDGYADAFVLLQAVEQAQLVGQ